MVDPAIQKIERLLNKGLFDDASALIADTIQSYGFDAPDKVYELLDRCAKRSAHAALQKGVLYRMGALTPPDPDAAERLFRSVVDGSDKDMRLLAAYSLGQLLCDKGDTDEGPALLRKAAEGHIPGAWYAYASALLEGPDGSAVVDHLLAELLSAHTAGDPRATSALGRVLNDYSLDLPGLDPVALLEDAERRGDPHAADCLADILGGLEDEDEDDEDEDEDEDDPLADILPYVVVPDGMKRPRLVRDALTRETAMPEEVAETLTARFHGFPEWRRMKNAAEDICRPKGPFDEDCTAAEYNERVEIQAEIATSFGFRDENVGDAVVQLLAPTSRKGKPSLRRLETKLEGQLFNIAGRQLRQGMEKVMQMVGIEGDPDQFMDFMRTRLPLNAAPLVDKLLEFGWKLQEVDTSPEKDGSRVARGAAPHGARFDIYVSVVSYVIGDRGDVHVEQLMKSIEEHGRMAALMFSRCRVYPLGDGRRGILYGGRAYDGLEWWDFAIRPGHGIEDVFSQKGRLANPMDPGFAGEFSYDGALEDCVALDAAAQGRDFDALGEVRLVGSDDGWKAPIYGELAEAFRELRNTRHG